MEKVPSVSSEKRVLFLCTGNYYRSRHAEAVFNHHAEQQGLPWRSTSRGLALERGLHNVGPIARTTLARLVALGIITAGTDRMPLTVQERDFSEAELIIALKEAEHRPLMEQRFPAWAEKVCYWAVHDVDAATPEESLPEIEREVIALLTRLATPE